MIFSRKNAIIVCAIMTLSSQAFAEDATKTYTPQANKSAYDNFDVLSRPRPEYETAGVQMGAFTARPSLEVKGMSNDNIKATDSNKDADMIAVISPEINVKSNFQRHELSVKANADIGRFRQDTDENYENYQGNIDGRIDIQNDLNVTAGVGYGSLHEDRTSSLAPTNTDEPVSFDKAGGYIGVNKQFNRLGLQASIDHTRFDYDDATIANGLTPVEQDDRDVAVTNYNGGGDYEFSPGYKAFTKGTYSDRNYFHDNTASNRDSVGYRQTVGVSAELTNLLVGEAEVGYAYRDYDNFSNVGTFVYGTALNWYPTPLLTARLTVDKDIVDGATTTSGASVGGIEQTRYGVQANYELRRNLIITPEVTYTEGDYQDTGDSEETYTASIKADYFLTRNVALEAGYEFSNRNSSIPVLNYDRNLFMLGVKTKI